MKNILHCFNLLWLAIESVNWNSEFLFSQCKLYTMCLAQEVKVDYFRIPSVCKSIFSVTYLSTAASPSHDPYSLSWSWSACQTLSHLQIPLTYVYYFFRSLTNILTNSGIVTDCLFCLNTYFSNLTIFTIPLASLLANGFSYLKNFFSTITSVYVSLQNMLAKAFSVNSVQSSLRVPDL